MNAKVAAAAAHAFNKLPFHAKNKEFHLITFKLLHKNVKRDSINDEMN